VFDTCSQLEHFLQSRGIQVWHHNGVNRSSKVRPNWIGFRCPRCLSGKVHLGFNLTSRRFSCWNCGKISTFEVFRHWFPNENVNALLQQLGFFDPYDPLGIRVKQHEREKNLAEGKEYTSISPGMGDGKAKINSSGLRRLRNKLPINGSIFVCVSQERTDITTGFKTVSGGAALRFYADTALWLTKGKPITKDWDGITRQYGQYSTFRIDKNRTSGMKAKIEFPILIGTGISDVDSCVDWLAEEKQFRVPKVAATQSWEGTFPDGSTFKLTRQKLIEYFEDHPEVVKEMMRRRWYDILDHVVPVRKKRYA